MIRSKFILPFILFILFLSSCKVNHLSQQETEFYRLEQSQYGQADQDIEAIIAPYKENLDEQMNEVIGEVVSDLTKARPESTLGNWFADAVYEYSKRLTKDELAFALQNYGGVRIPSIVKGSLTRGKLYELMPFDNMILILDLDANTLKMLINKMAASGGWPVSKQLRYEIKDKTAVNITINGAPIDDNKIYKVVIPDYIANGGGGCHFLRDQTRKDYGVLVRDALITYVEEQTAAGKKLDAVLDGRTKLNQY